MRILTVHTPGSLREETAFGIASAIAACPERAVWDKREIESRDQQAYGRIIAECWNADDDLFIIEPDVEISSETLFQARACQYGYCGFSYSWGPEVGIALGATRFRKSFMEKYADAARRAVAERVSFRQFDVVFQRHILAREYGQQPHAHGAVIHWNPAKQLAPNGRPEPITVLPHW